MACPTYTTDSKDILSQAPDLRVITTHNEAGTPASCRVIWSNHVSEMTDLSPAEHNEIMEMVYQIKATVRQVFRPARISLVSLGNAMSHLHRYTTARFENGANFPASIWTALAHGHGMALSENWP